MEEHKEFTFGWLIFVILITAHLLMTFLYVNGIGNRPMGTVEYLIVTSVFVVMVSLFYGMTTKVTADTVTVSFGIGLFRKKIKLERVTSVDTVRSPWYYGWGIRIIPNGMLYNISGFSGVELKFNDTKRIVRIGSKDASMLKREIERRVG